MPHYLYLYLDLIPRPEAAPYPRLRLRDPPGGVEETPNTEARTANSGPTRGVLFLEGDCPRTGTVPKTVLLDISGRKVVSLRPGPNDVSRLARGVYFLRPETGGPGDLRKVVLQ